MCYEKWPTEGAQHHYVKNQDYDWVYSLRYVVCAYRCAGLGGARFGAESTGYSKPYRNCGVGQCELLSFVQLQLCRRHTDYCSLYSTVLYKYIQYAYTTLRTYFSLYLDLST